MSINRVNISGNLTRDPELRQTASGMPVLGFGVAVNDRRKNPQTGEWEDYPNFIDCTMFGARAESLARYLSKGAKVSIEGKLRWSQWERDGQKRSKIEVIIDDIEFMTQRDRNHGTPQAYAPQASQTYAQQTPQQYGTQQYAPQAPQYAQQPAQGYPQQQTLYDSDIPF